MPALDTVIKVGGSLFVRPDLAGRLRTWLAALPSRHILLVPGGGAAADVVRDLDRRHHLGEENSHWLALRAVALNAWFLASLLPDSDVVTDFEQCPACWQHGKTPILDAHAFATGDEDRVGHLPHSWEVTSDSLAARAAIVGQARQLILLKSTPTPEGIEWSEAGRRGFVDVHFAPVLAAAKALTVRAVSLDALPLA